MRLFSLRSNTSIWSSKPVNRRYLVADRDQQIKLLLQVGCGRFALRIGDDAEGLSEGVTTGLHPDLVGAGHRDGPAEVAAGEKGAALDPVRIRVAHVPCVAMHPGSAGRSVAI